MKLIGERMAEVLWMGGEIPWADRLAEGLAALALELLILVPLCCWLPMGNWIHQR